jgi:hypothetical protein
VSELAEAKKQPETAAAGGVVVASENTGGGTPRKSRRLSETVPVQAETVEPCAPLTTGRSKKASDAKKASEEEATGTPLAGTPRKSRRLSETLLPPTGTTVEAISTLPPRNRKVSELSATGEQLRAASPARKSRRLSGGGVEEDAGRPVLLTPTRTSRRRSICALDKIPPVIAEEEQPAKVTDEQMDDEAVEEVAAANKMEAIVEVEEEDAGVAVADTPSAIDVKSETMVPTQPEVDAPEVAQPEVDQPEIAQPEVALAEVAQAEVAQPEVAQSEVAQPEVAQPEVAQPEVAQPEVVQTIKATEGKKKVVELGEALEALQRLMLPQVPRQKPKSGKFWKADRSQFRAIRNTCEVFF